MDELCAADLFRLQGHYDLLIVDYYSKFIAVKICKTINLKL